MVFGWGSGSQHGARRGRRGGYSFPPPCRGNLIIDSGLISFELFFFSVQIPTLLKGYESDSALHEVRSKSPHGQGRILLAVDQTSPSSEQNDRGGGVENRTMNSALEQLIEELKQPNLDIERFTRQMSTTPFSAKSNKSQYIHSTDKAIRLFSDSKLTKTVKTMNLTEIDGI